MKQLIRRLEDRLRHSRKAAEKSKYLHTRERAVGRIEVIEDVLSELRYEAKGTNAR